MGTVMIRCPQTGREIPTGITTDRDSFNATPVFFAQTYCPICRLTHEWFARNAWVDERAGRRGAPRRHRASEAAFHWAAGSHPVLHRAPIESECDADPLVGPPCDPTGSDDAVEQQVEPFRDAHRARHLQTGAALRQVPDHAIDHRGFVVEYDLAGFQGPQPWLSFGFAHRVAPRRGLGFYPGPTTDPLTASGERRHPRGSAAHLSLRGFNQPQSTLDCG